MGPCRLARAGPATADKPLLPGEPGVSALRSGSSSGKRRLHTGLLWVWNSGHVSPPPLQLTSKCELNTFHTSSQIYDLIYLEVVQEHLRRGQRRSPWGREHGCVALHGREVSGDQRDGWPGCTTLPGQAKALGGMGWPGLHFRMKTRRPFSKPGYLCHQIRPALQLPGFDLHPRLQREEHSTIPASLLGFVFTLFFKKKLH